MILFLIFLYLKNWGQSDTDEKKDTIQNSIYFKTDITLITGYQFQKNHFFEIGIGIKKDGKMGHHPSTMIYGLSNELKFSSDFIWGLKAGYWIGGGSSGLNLGLNLINYTDFKKNAIRFRPEIGFGFNSFRIVYGYNFTMTNKDFENINRHLFGLNIILNLKTIKE